MTDVQSGIDETLLLPEFSGKLLNSPAAYFHSLRGFDFAALENILKIGIQPSLNHLGWSVSLSVSPTNSSRVNRPANSLYAYTLREGISLVVELPGRTILPSESYGGFHDEIRVPLVMPEELYGIMIREDGLYKPLKEISTNHEPRLSARFAEYVDRTTKHLESFGIELSENTKHAIKEAESAYDSTHGGNSRSVTALLEKAFLNEYVRTLQEKYDISNPSIVDLIRVVSSRAGVQLPIFYFNQSQIDSVVATNTRIESLPAHMVNYERAVMVQIPTPVQSNKPELICKTVDSAEMLSFGD